MISTPGPAGTPGGSGPPGVDPVQPGSATPAGAPPRTGPAVPRRLRPPVIVIVLLGFLGLASVPVLWFVVVVALWALGGGDASPPGPPGPPAAAGGAPISQVVFSPDGTLAALVSVSASSDATRVTVSDAATGKMITTVADPHGVDAAAISPDDTTWPSSASTAPPTCVTSRPGS